MVEQGSDDTWIERPVYNSNINTVNIIKQPFSKWNQNIINVSI